MTSTVSASTPSATAGTSPTAAARPVRKPLFRRDVALRWLRQTHGWFGLWGAILGLIFGIAGIWLNHRAVLKLPMAQQRINAQLALPDPAPGSAPEMAAWLQAALRQGSAPNTTRIEPAKPVAWAAKGSAAPPLMQPEHWIFNFGGPDEIVQADYWRGNRSVGVATSSNGVIATMTNLHKGVGMPVGWILLVDTLAGSIVFLSLSGVALWVMTNRRRTLGFAILGTSVVLTLGLIASRL